MATQIQNPTAPASTQEMFQRAAILQNINRAKQEKLEHPGAMRAVWDTVTFQRGKHAKQAEGFKSANELIKQILDSVARAYEKMNK